MLIEKKVKTLILSHPTLKRHQVFKGHGSNQNKQAQCLYAGTPDGCLSQHSSRPAAEHTANMFMLPEIPAYKQKDLGLEMPGTLPWQALPGNEEAG